MAVVSRLLGTVSLCQNLFLETWLPTEPFAVLYDMSNETALAKIAAALDQVTAEADERAGTQPLS